MIAYTLNSCYELDLVSKKIRRLKGSEDPTPRQGDDGAWKEYTDIVGPVPGKPMLVLWEGVRCTKTSVITKIQQDLPS